MFSGSECGSGAGECLGGFVAEGAGLALGAACGFLSTRVVELLALALAGFKLVFNGCTFGGVVAGLCEGEPFVGLFDGCFAPVASLKCVVGFFLALANIIEGAGLVEELLVKGLRGVGLIEQELPVADLLVDEGIEAGA